MSNSSPPDQAVMVRLSIDAAQIGDHRTRCVFTACRQYAESVSPGCYIMAVRENHERVGWDFLMPSRMAALRLRLVHAAAMKGRPRPGT